MIAAAGEQRILASFSAVRFSEKCPESGRCVLQCLDEEEDFGGHGVVQVRGVGEGAVAAAGDDGFEGFCESVQTGGLGVVRKLIEKGYRLRGVAGEQGLSYGETDAAIGAVILTA